VIDALPPASWEMTLKGLHAPCAGGRRLPLRPLEGDAYAEAAEEQTFLPAPLGRGLDGRFYWWFQHGFVRSAQSLEPEEIAAKFNALERDRRNRASALRMKAMKAMVERRDDGACVTCGSTEDVHVEMAVPASMGGAMSFENLHLLCTNCSAMLERRRAS
jgi:hypothetical protein